MDIKLPDKLPADFKKNTLLYLLFVFMGVIGVLWGKSEISNKRQIQSLQADRDTCRVATYILGVENRIQNEKIRKLDSAASGLAATLKTLERMGVIK